MFVRAPENGRTTPVHQWFILPELAIFEEGYANGLYGHSCLTERDTLVQPQPPRDRAMFRVLLDCRDRSSRRAERLCGTLGCHSAAVQKLWLTPLALISHCFSLVTGWPQDVEMIAVFVRGGAL